MDSEKLAFTKSTSLTIRSFLSRGMNFEGIIAFEVKISLKKWSV